MQMSIKETCVKNAGFKDFMYTLELYACFGASTGQTLAHVPQSTHTLSSITKIPSPSVIQVTGHSAAQAPQLIHSLLIL
jgi:hypothetical protein